MFDIVERRAFEDDVDQPTIWGDGTGQSDTALVLFDGLVIV